MDWDLLWRFLPLLLIVFYILRKVDKLEARIGDLSEKVANLRIQVPEYHHKGEATFKDRIRSLELQVFRATGDERFNEDQRDLISRLYEFDSRLNRVERKVEESLS